jgi:hypothetical protein
MRVALLNPCWSFEGSIYLGCRDPHLPLEHGYAKALLQPQGHETLLIDAHLRDLGLGRRTSGVSSTCRRRDMRRSIAHSDSP